MKTNKRNRDRRRHKRRQNSNNHAAPPPHPHKRSRSRHRRRDDYSPRNGSSRSRHRSHRRSTRSPSISSSSSYKRRRRRRSSSSRQHRERRRRDDDGESAAYIVSDSDNEDRKRPPGNNNNNKKKKWWENWACGGAAYYSPSSSLDSYNRNRHDRTSRRRKRRTTRHSRDRSRRKRSSSSSEYSRRNHHRRDVKKRRRDSNDDTDTNKRRPLRDGDTATGRKKRRSHKSNSSSGNPSDSSKDDTIGHFRGGPGTSIGERYRILRDVGLGTFGRVVECSVGGDMNHHRVAIKIVRNVRRYYDSALIEADICERVNREQRRQNKDLCAKMLDRFSLPTRHYCLVFEKLGRSLYDFLKMNGYKPFPMFCVKDFSRQLLEALDFLHGFGLIHTDLKPENILLCHDDLGPQEVPGSTKIKVIDFGGATYDNEKKSSIVNTRQYRAPEVILGFPRWSYPSDLWSAGCIIAELYTGHLLFQTHDNAEHLALMEQTCGKFKREILDRSTSPLARECFNSRGWHRLKGVLSSRSAEHVRETKQIERLVSFDDRSTGLADLLSSLLKLDPMDRASARQALGRRFFA